MRISGDLAVGLMHGARVVAVSASLLWGVLLLAGCAAGLSPAADKARQGAVSPEFAAAPERRIEYLCDGDRRVAVILQGTERATLRVSGAWVDMAAMRTAAGVKYRTADGSITLWSQGNKARIKTGATDLACRILP